MASAETGARVPTPSADGRRGLPAPSAVVAYRPARDEDLDACTRVWKAGIDDYATRLNQPPVPDDVAPLRRLLAHMLATDPDRFWTATDAADDGAVVGFSAATVRDDLWFLAMLFVDPARQAGGVGSRLMDLAQAGRHVEPGGPAVPGPDDALGTAITRWGMSTDALQPISNALYARRGMPPRLPIWHLLGEVRRPGALPPPPNGTELVPFEEIAADAADGHRRLAAIVDGLDREIIGLTHGRDHAYLRREGRSGVLLRERGGRPLGYAYGSGVGRLGPALAIDPALHPALLAAAIRATPVQGPVAVWVPGTAPEATRALLDAGLRFDGFPALLCWSAAEHPFDRYLPISLALV